MHDEPPDRTLFEFLPYTVEALKDVLKDADAGHLDYLRDYFQYYTDAGHSLTIVVESHYTDRDYLEDYAAYYVRCFEDKYKKTCRRLHFFRGHLEEKDFLPSLEPDTEVPSTEAINEQYLGFLVVRPLPHACIGRTCLKTYECEGRRYYPVKRRCEAHLLGHTFSVDSLPFQQQDAVAAACATSALWSALQGTATLFQHKIYSPVEITTIAAKQSPGLERTFPNRGLDPPQMANAVRAAGLEPEVVGVSRKQTLQATAYAYLHEAKIPLIMNAALFDTSFSDGPRPFDGDWDTGHAVTITGYSLGRPSAEPYPDTDTLLRSSRIDKLYVHDDGIGPFARMGLDGPDLGVVSFGEKEKSVPFTMNSSWKGLAANAHARTVVFAPDTLIIPVYHKIRVDLDAILYEVFFLDEHDLKRSDDSADHELEWEVFLTTQSKFKSELRRTRKFDLKTRIRLLKKSFPRFLWRAIAYCGNDPRYGLVFDATDVAESPQLLLEILTYS
ncbi:MAG: hypothetical protein IH987_11820 [Planctomycetes bacterium]|nr:hypothetical protein [Planctomycetota bacterium]